MLAQRTYFVPTMAAYVLGLGGAFAANAITHLGQPALLYLVRQPPGLLQGEGRGSGLLSQGLPGMYSDKAKPVPHQSYRYPLPSFWAQSGAWVCTLMSRKDDIYLSNKHLCHRCPPRWARSAARRYCAASWTA